VKILFRVALAIMGQMNEALMECEDLAELFTVMENYPKDKLDGDLLLR